MTDTRQFFFPPPEFLNHDAAANLKNHPKLPCNVSFSFFRGTFLLVLEIAL